MSKDLTPITVAYGDGIGPEIMQATLDILIAAGARIKPEVIEIGKAVYESGEKTGIAPSSWESFARTKVFLKAPITTPQGGGFKSLNVTVRKTLGLFANVRPCVSYAPYVETKHPNMDLVIVRENEEDLYGGIEYRHTQSMVEAVKLISRPGSERIVRYAFEYARANGRKKVTCMSKDNIMKMTDGLFHRVFDEIGAEYPDIIQDHYIIDIGSAKVAASPHIFDVIVTTNLYGDIISDIAAEVTGSVGLAGSSNVGEDFAMFEAIHGSAPDIAGKGIANPSGLLNGAIMMLTHIGQPDVAEKIQNAWLVTLEDGIHTGEIYREGSSKKKVGTKEFSEAVIARLGQKPVRLRVADYSNAPEGGVHLPPLKPICFEEKKLVGVDLFLDWQGLPDVLGDKIVDLAKGSGLTLKIISNRGVKVWPHGHPDTFTADHWRLRLFAESGVVDHIAIYSLANKLAAAGLDVIKIENLYTFNDKAGYSLAQGE